MNIFIGWLLECDEPDCPAFLQLPYVEPKEEGFSQAKKDAELRNWVITNDRHCYCENHRKKVGIIL